MQYAILGWNGSYKTSKAYALLKSGVFTPGLLNEIRFKRFGGDPPYTISLKDVFHLVHRYAITKSKSMLNMDNIGPFLLGFNLGTISFLYFSLKNKY